jgi:hypothetical protein
MARGLLIAVSIMNGAAGLICGALLIVGPEGQLLQAGALLSVIQAMPLASVFFRDFLWIGMAMLTVLGAPNSVAAVMLLRRSENQYLATAAAGVLLLIWCAFELVFMFNWLAVGYVAVGLVSVACSILLSRQEPARA